MPPSPAYIPLWTKSNFSFLEGASHPEELVSAARQLGLGALALTDRDGVQGIVRAHVAAREHGLPLLVGSQLTVAARLPLPRGERLSPAEVAQVAVETPVLLAMDRGGYANL